MLVNRYQQSKLFPLFLTVMAVSGGLDAARAQGPQAGEQLTFEQMIDASYGGARPVQRRGRLSRERTRPEPIQRDLVFEQRRRSTVTSEPVSLARLRHEPLPKAEREFLKAQEAAAEGDAKESIERLERAVALDPAYIEARNNLGVRYLEQGDAAAAIEQFERAAELDPVSPEPSINLAVALHAIGQWDAAVANAERGVKLAPHSAGAHFVLGAVLADEGRNLVGAVEHLRRSSSEFPKAHLLAADALLARGEAAAARAELKSFLAVSGPLGNP